MRIVSASLAFAISLMAFGCAHRPAVAPAPSPSPSPPSATHWIEVVATTDTHGQVEARHTTVQTANGPLALDHGGSELLSGYLKILRTEHPGRVLLIDGGDLFTGTLAADLSEGQIVIDAMNALGYDATAVGNHEFDFGPAGPHVTPEPGEDGRGALRERAKAAKFPLLSANLSESTTSSQWMQPYVIKTLDGVKVAIVGGTTDGLRATTLVDNLPGLVIKPIKEGVATAIRSARADGAELVVLTVHAGSECSKNHVMTDIATDDLARCDRNGEVFALVHALAADPATRPNLVIGGHTHKALTAIIDGIPVVQAEPKGRGFALAALEIDTSTHKPTGHFRIEPTTYTCSHNLDGGEGCPPNPSPSKSWHAATYHGQPVVRDPIVVAALAPHLERVRAVATALVGATALHKFDSIYAHENALGNLIADTLRAAGKAEIGLMNGGGIRADLPAGELHYSDVFEVMPFHNKLATADMTGAAIRKLVVSNVMTDHGILSLSGLRVDARCEGGQSRVDVFTSDGKLLDDKRRYKLASVDFLLKGGDDFAGVEATPKIGVDAPLLRDLLLAELKRRGTVDSHDPTLYDHQNPRMRIQGHRPLRCPATATATPTAPPATP